MMLQGLHTTYHRIRYLGLRCHVVPQIVGRGIVPGTFSRIPCADWQYQNIVRVQEAGNVPLDGKEPKG